MNGGKEKNGKWIVEAQTIWNKYRENSGRVLISVATYRVNKLSGKIISSLREFEWYTQLFIDIAFLDRSGIFEHTSLDVLNTYQQSKIDNDVNSLTWIIIRGYTQIVKCQFELT